MKHFKIALVLLVIIFLALFYRSGSALDANELASVKGNDRCLVAESLLLAYPEKRGDFVSSYTSPSNDILDWLSKFDIVEIGGTGDIASRKTIRFLRDRGVKKIFCYDWMPAVYYYLSGKNYQFTNWVYENAETATLNPNGPFPHTEEEGYTFARDYYLDLGNKEVINRRVAFTAKLLSDNSYSGIFWDWAPGVFINEPEFSAIKNNFSKKHPGKKYSSAVWDFYSSLRKKCNSLGFEIFTNQGYRNAGNVLPYTDYDMAESYVTNYFYPGNKIKVKGYGEVDMPQTLYFPVSQEENQSFYDTLYYADYVKKLVKKYAGKQFKKFVFVNYAAPDFVFDEAIREYIAYPPKEAIYLSFAVAKLVDETAYLEIPFDKTLEKDKVYFVDLGKAYANDFAVNKKENYAVRYFENGISIVYFGKKQDQTITLKGKFIPQSGYFFDVYENAWKKIDSGKIVLQIRTKKDPLTGKTIPAGRILMYNKHSSMPLPVILPF